MLNFWDLKTWSQRDRPLGPHDLYLIVPGKARNGSTGSLVTSAIRLCIPSTDKMVSHMKEQVIGHGILESARPDNGP